MIVHDFRVNAETVHEPLATDLADDPLVVVVAKRAAELIVAHVGLVLMVPPPDSDSIGFQETKLPLFRRVCPLDQVAVLSFVVSEYGVEKLPELHSSFSYKDKHRLLFAHTLLF